MAVDSPVSLSGQRRLFKRMSYYCSNCKYKPQLKTGANACPMTTLYWNFLINHHETFRNKPRTALMAKNAESFDQIEIQAIQMHAKHLLTHLDDLQHL